MHAFVVTGDTVSVLIDANSDGREIELKIYRRRLDVEWASVCEIDDIANPGMAPVEMSGYA